MNNIKYYSMRTTTNISITLPPSLLKQATKVAKEEGRTQSELVREALRKYFVNQQWERLRVYGQKRAKETGLTEADVVPLIKAYRKEQGLNKRVR